MTVCGKHGKTIKLFSHPSHSPWKSLRRFPHYHRHGYDEHEYLSNPRNQNQRNDAQYHYPGGPNQMIKVGHAGIANSNNGALVGNAMTHIISARELLDFAVPMMEAVAADQLTARSLTERNEHS